MNRSMERSALAKTLFTKQGFFRGDLALKRRSSFWRKRARNSPTLTVLATFHSRQVRSAPRSSKFERFLNARRSLIASQSQRVTPLRAARRRSAEAGSRTRTRATERSDGVGGEVAP